MARLNPESTEKDIDALIAEAEAARDKTDDLNIAGGHADGAFYLKELKSRLALNQTSKPTGKKMLRSNLREEVLKKWEAWKEAVGTEQPTPERQGELNMLAWMNKSFDVKIEGIAEESAKWKEAK